MQNHNDTIKTSDTVLRKIYLSLNWKGCEWEGVGERTELQHIDPHSIGHNRVSFPFSWAAQPGTWGLSLSGTCSHSSIFSPTRLIPNCSVGGLRAPSAGCWLSLPHLSPTGLVSKLTDFLSSPSYAHLLPVGVTNCTHSIHPRSRLHSAIPRPDAPVIYIGAYPILTAWPGRRSIYNKNIENKRIFLWNAVRRKKLRTFWLKLLSLRRYGRSKRTKSYLMRKERESEGRRVIGQIRSRWVYRNKRLISEWVRAKALLVGQSVMGEWLRYLSITRTTGCPNILPGVEPAETSVPLAETRRRKGTTRFEVSIEDVKV